LKTEKIAKMKTDIKLFKLDTLSNGTIRLQSQLYLNRLTADFILKDGLLYCYGWGNSGFNFYKYDGDYEIVNRKDEMFKQVL